MKNKIFALSIAMIIFVSPSIFAGPIVSDGIVNRYLKRIKIKINIRNERAIQYEVKNGHQPWRLVDVDVARSAVNQYCDDTASVFRRKFIESKNKKVTIEFTGMKLYRVKLMKLFGPIGIWTAVEIEVKGIE